MTDAPFWSIPDPVDDSYPIVEFEDLPLEDRRRKLLYEATNLAGGALTSKARAMVEELAPKAKDRLDISEMAKQVAETAKIIDLSGWLMASPPEIAEIARRLAENPEFGMNVRAADCFPMYTCGQLQGNSFVPVKPGNIPQAIVVRSNPNEYGIHLRLDAFGNKHEERTYRIKVAKLW